VVLVYHDRDIAAELDEAENCLAPATFLKNQFTAVYPLERPTELGKTM